MKFFRLFRGTKPEVETRPQDLGLDLYQSLAKTFAVYPPEKAQAYTILGLASEAGEVAGKAKKILRGDGTVTKDDIAAELGDVLWYVAMTADAFGLSLKDIGGRNIRKLNERERRGTIKGNGDER